MNINPPFFYKTISDSLSYKLDISRALAALLVLLSHLRGSWFTTYSELSPETQGPLNYILFFITRIGHECVIIFFVLSGFLVGGSAVSEFLNKKFSIKLYFIKRLSRMWSVVLPALLLGWIIDLQTVKLDPTVTFQSKLTLTNFIGNVFFLQWIIVPTFGSNVPLWSLAAEFWFYFFAGFIVLFLVILKSIYVRIFLSVLLILLMAVIMPSILVYLPMWLLGTFIRFLPLNNFFGKPIIVLALLITLIASIAFSNYTDSLLGNYVLAIAFSINIYAWMCIRKSNESPKHRIRKIIELFAKFSFSLYAVHYFFLEYIFAYFSKNMDFERVSNANLIAWLGFIGIAFITIFISYLFYYLFERNTGKIKSLFIKIF